MRLGQQVAVPAADTQRRQPGPAPAPGPRAILRVRACVWRRNMSMRRLRAMVKIHVATEARVGSNCVALRQSVVMTSCAHSSAIVASAPDLIRKPLIRGAKCVEQLRECGCGPDDPGRAASARPSQGLIQTTFCWIGLRFTIAPLRTVLSLPTRFRARS